MLAELRGLALERLTVVAELFDQLTRFVGADAGTFGKVLDFIAFRGRVGLSTSLLDVSFVVSALAGAAIFGAVTAGGPSYELLLMIAGGLSTLGAVMLVTAHRLLGAKNIAPA